MVHSARPHLLVEQRQVPNKLTSSPLPARFCLSSWVPVLAGGSICPATQGGVAHVLPPMSTQWAGRSVPTQCPCWADALHPLGPLILVQDGFWLIPPSGVPPAPSTLLPCGHLISSPFPHLPWEPTPPPQPGVLRRTRTAEDSVTQAPSAPTAPASPIHPSPLL